MVSWCQLAAETNQTLLVWKHSNFIDIFNQSDANRDEDCAYFSNMRRIFITLSLTLCHSLSTLSHNFTAYGYPQCVIGINTNAKFVIIKRKYVTVFEHNICMQRFVTLCWANTWEDVIYTWQLVANWKKCIIGFEFHPHKIVFHISTSYHSNGKTMKKKTLSEFQKRIGENMKCQFKHKLEMHIGYSNSFGK